MWQPGSGNSSLSRTDCTAVEPARWRYKAETTSYGKYFCSEIWRGATRRSRRRSLRRRLSRLVMVMVITMMMIWIMVMMTLMMIMKVKVVIIMMI